MPIDRRQEIVHMRVGSLDTDTNLANAVAALVAAGYVGAGSGQVFEALEQYLETVEGSDQELKVFWAPIVTLIQSMEPREGGATLLTQARDVEVMLEVIKLANGELFRRVSGGPSS